MDKRGHSITYNYGVTEPDRDPVNHWLDPVAYNVHYLHAPHALLIRTFGNDRKNSCWDYKSMAQWIIPTSHGDVEVYDYKVGKCYDPDGLERHEITEWHIQGNDEAIKIVLDLMHKADKEKRSLTPKRTTTHSSETRTR